MSGRTPYQAWATYAAPLQEALRCIASGRFVLTEPPTGMRAGIAYSIALNDMNSVPLKVKGRQGINLVAGQTIETRDWKPTYTQERYRIALLSYVYGLTMTIDDEELELLTFHLNRNGKSSSSVPAGHLHIGRGLLARHTPVRPRDFHRAHIPTGTVSFADVVRFAIAELGVTPLTTNWPSILAAADNASES